MPGDPDRKWFAGQVTSPGGPSCPRVASQEGRMRFVVLRRLSLTLLSSAWREKLDYWFQARLSSSCLFFYSSFSVCSILHLFLSCLSTHFIFFWHHPFLLLLLFPRLYEMWVNTADTGKPHRPRSHSITLRGLTSLLIYRLRFILFLTLIYLFVLLLFYCPYIHIKYGSQFMWWRTSKVRLLGLVCSKMKCMHTAD